jgi:hypothetical protein
LAEDPRGVRRGLKRLGALLGVRAMHRNACRRRTRAAARSDSAESGQGTARVRDDKWVSLVNDHGRGRGLVGRRCCCGWAGRRLRLDRLGRVEELGRNGAAGWTATQRARPQFASCYWARMERPRGWREKKNLNN